MNGRRTRAGEGELPLLAWLDEARRRRLEHRRRVRRWALFVAPIIAAVALSIALPARPCLVWNASASAPIGLYFVTPDASPRRGETVVAPVPETVRALVASRRYVPRHVPLVKHVGGVAGNVICAVGAIITIDGTPAATRRRTDGAGRPMPWWSGCRRVRAGEVFLLSPAVAASFDARYFGITSTTDIIGTARPLWTW